MKHVAYTTFHSKAWKAFKQCGLARSEAGYARFARRLFECALRAAVRKHGWAQCTQSSAWDRDCCYADNLMDFLWRFRPLQHFFLADGVADFCCGAVKEFSAEFAKALPVCPLVAAPAGVTKETTFVREIEAGKIQGGFVIHFPAKERRSSVIVVPGVRIPVSGAAELLFYFCASDGEDTVLSNEDSPELAGLREGSWIPKLVFGLSLYMDAFPDTVVAASDDRVCKANHYSGPRRLIGRHAIVSEEERAGVSPHWRRGHFRLLSSAVFVHKQGQTVYVRGAFVKGTACDVLNDAPAAGGLGNG